MVAYCAPGTGPGTSCEKMLRVNGKDPKSVDPRPDNKAQYTPREVLASINWLRVNADAQFSRLGLCFPYLSTPRSWEIAGGRRELTCVDLEHSLCYFSRLINIRHGLGEGGSRRLHGAVISAIRERKLKRWKIKALANHCHGENPPPPDQIVDNILASLPAGVVL